MRPCVFLTYPLIAFVLFGCATTPEQQDEDAAAKQHVHSGDAALGVPDDPDATARRASEMLSQDASARDDALVIDTWTISWHEADRAPTTCGTIHDVSARQGNDIRPAVLIVGCREQSTAAPTAAQQRVIAAGALAAAIVSGGAVSRAQTSSVPPPSPYTKREQKLGDAIASALGLQLRTDPQKQTVPDYRLVLDAKRCGSGAELCHAASGQPLQNGGSPRVHRSSVLRFTAVFRGGTMSQYPCPTCRDRPMTTVASAPYVRGFLVAYQVGTKRFVGCPKCVASDIRKEALLSMLLGWFSITAIVINPFLILYNILQSFLVNDKPAKVRALLAELGMPETPDDGSLRMVDVGSMLAAAMILADGVVEPDEIEMANAIGHKLFDDYSEKHMHDLLAAKDLPDPGDLAGMVRDVLDDDAKRAIYEYLRAIAGSDGSIAMAEQNVLDEVADHMGYRP